jgi:hypothetical protein
MPALRESVYLATPVIDARSEQSLLLLMFGQAGIFMLPREVNHMDL